MDHLEGFGHDERLDERPVRVAFARKAAEQVLKRHGVRQPPVSVTDIAAALGFSLEEAVLRRGLDARMHHSGEAKSIEVAAGTPSVRRRFSIAHELGHFCLGHAHDDGREAEQEANIFAGALLVPANWLRADVRRGVQTDELAARYEVSKEVVFIRLKDSRLLDQAR